MCDYSLHTVNSRSAETSDVLMSCRFPGTQTRGFASPDDPLTALCLRPGTELVFDSNVRIRGFVFSRRVGATLARFRQVDLDKPAEHHDALEFANGRIVKVTDLMPGQRARIVQMPPDVSKRTIVREPTSASAESRPQGRVRRTV